MGTLTRGLTFGATETVTNTKLHNLVDDGSVSEIVNADIDANAAIVDTKLDTITTGSKVSGLALFGLGSIPSGGGRIISQNIAFNSVLASHIANSSVDNRHLSGSIDDSKLNEITSSNKVDFTSLNIASQAQGDLAYYNGSQWTRLGAGTDGQVLKTNGAGANPEWINNYLVLKSVTSPSGVSTTSDISISTNKIYKIVFDLAPDSSQTAFGIRFNSSSSGDYNYNSPAGDLANQTSIQIASSSAGGNSLSGEILIFTKELGTNNEARVTGTIYYGDSGATSGINTANFSGDWRQANDVTSFEFIGDQNFSGDIYTYEMGLSV